MDSVQDLRTGGYWFDLSSAKLFRIDKRHCNRIHSSLTGDHCVDDGDVGKQQVTQNVDCAEHW